MLPKIKQITELVLISMVIIMVKGLSSQPCYGQKDTLKNFKNTVQINISNPMIFGSKYKVIGYQRVIKDYQTASLSIGRFALPRFIEFDTDSIGIKDQYNDMGFHLSLDYRFYLQKENKYRAPRGIYLGPYYAFNYLSRDLTWNLNTSTFTGEVGTTMNLMANLIGVQLGYQFVFWDRLSVDIILMGPGVWFFNLNSDFNSTLTSEDESMLLEELNNMLEERFPGSDLVIQGGGLEASRVTHTSTMGFRYMVNLGFRF